MIRLLLIFAFLAIVILIAIRLQGNGYKRFRAGAAEVMGKIEKKEARIDNSKNRHAENILIYSYVVDGKEYPGEERVEYDDLWLDARVGMELRVYYAKTNPAKSYPAALIDRRLGISEKIG